jgi:hypothetical protein
MVSARRILISSLLLLSLGVPSSAAPDSLLRNADQSFLWAPVANFPRELDRLAPPGSCEFRAVPTKWPQDEAAQSRQAEQQEIRAVLDGLATARRGDSGWADEQTNTLASFNAARDQINALRNNLKSGPVTLNLVTPTGFPAEFAEYLVALADYHSGKLPEARARWEKMLKWPEAERRHRGVWAAYMIGKTRLKTWDALIAADDPIIDDPVVSAERAILSFRKTRELARAGFPDPLGLAASSLSWEASADLDLACIGQPMVGATGLEIKTIASRRADYVIRSIHLYLQAHAAGEAHADEALQLLCKDLFDEQPEVLEELTRDDQSAAVVTAFVLARGGKFVSPPKPEQVKRWLESVKSATAHPTIGPKVIDFLGADRLLLACYLYHLEANTTADWRSRSPASPLSDWIWAKVCLAGAPPQIDLAAILLARAAAGFPTDEVRLDVGGGSYENGRRALIPHNRINAELGAVELTRGRYSAALDLLLRAGWQEDAAYIAECVLTPEELTAYVDANWPPALLPSPAANSPPPGAAHATSDEECCSYIRSMLARRLTRLGRWKQARPYFTDRVAVILDAYVSAIRQGHDADRSDDDRAESFKSAAQLARDHWMQLFEHETEAARAIRSPGSQTFVATTLAACREHPASGDFLGASPDEVRRTTANAPQHRSDWGAALIAADHVWTAAQLMPDESDETARFLCVAGNWLINDDPKAAGRFYRALTERCSTTDLGRQAAKINGLPRTP